MIRLTDQEANEGKQVVLKCKINCTPPPKISWFKGGNEITKDPRVKTYKDPNGFDCLTINSASRGMAGEYEIRATNDMGTASSKCNIKVNSEYSNNVDQVRFIPRYLGHYQCPNNVYNIFSLGILNFILILRIQTTNQRKIQRQIRLTNTLGSIY